MIDPIVEEVRAARASIAAEFGYDRARFLAWAREREKTQRQGQSPLPKGGSPKVKLANGNARKAKPALSQH